MRLVMRITHMPVGTQCLEIGIWDDSNVFSMEFPICRSSQEYEVKGMRLMVSNNGISTIQPCTDQELQVHMSICINIFYMYKFRFKTNNSQLLNQIIWA